MIKAVIFDFDDTLCMTSESNHRIFSQVLRDMGYKPLSYEEHKLTVGEPLKISLARRFPDIDIQDFSDRLLKIRTAMLAKGLIENIPPENLDALDELARQGKQLMVLTSRRPDGIKYAMDPSHHLGSRLTHFYHLGNNPHHKPDPKAFAVIEKEHGLKPAECVYVGDALNDAAAATGAGLHFIASLESGILTKKDFAGFKVGAFINKLPEVIPAIAGLE